MASIAKIIFLLRHQYPRATTELVHKNTLQLLISTILSSQCTDKTVNIVTKKLFKKYITVKDFANASQKTLEKEIKSTGFYKNKTKNIISSAKIILNTFGGKIPNTMKDLTTLPGVARKTANIVLWHGFRKNEGIAVDTHVKRLSGRLKLSYHTDPNKIEKDLIRKTPKKYWGQINNLFVLHGRYVCTARKPKCKKCVLNKICLKNK